MLRRCKSKPAGVLFKSIFFYTLHLQNERTSSLPAQQVWMFSMCSTYVTVQEPKKHLQKPLELRHRAHRLQLQHSTEKMVFQCFGSLKCILAQLKPEKREGFPSRQWMEKLFQVGVGRLVLFVLLNSNNI